MLEKIVLLFFRFYFYNRDKFIRLTFFHCERMATQNITFMVDFDTFFTKSILLLLSVCVPSFTQLSVVGNAADREIYHKVVRKTIAFTISAAVPVLFKFDLPFWVIRELK